MPSWWDGKPCLNYRNPHILPHYVQNYRPLLHPHLYFKINLLKFANIISHVANIINHTKCASTQYKKILNMCKITDPHMNKPTFY